MRKSDQNLRKPIVIAVVGKGGAGKTLFTTLMTKVLSEQYNLKLLLIDADPTHPHLCNMVNLSPNKSLEEIRKSTIERTIRDDENRLEIVKDLDFEIYDAMGESKKFNILSIGQPTDPGCFCPSNLLLRNVLKSIRSEFDIMLIDCEAGLEQITRKIVNNIDFLLIVSDVSMRSLETANSIRKVAQNLINIKKFGLIINNVKGDIGILLERIKEYDLPIIGRIPYEERITHLEINSIPLINISNKSKALQSVEEITKNILNQFDLP
jgi:CO dehydrogenase maturation factor